MTGADLIVGGFGLFTLGFILYVTIVVDATWRDRR